MTGVYVIPPFRTTTDEIEDWIEKLKNFILAMHGSQCGEDRKLAILKTVIGDEAALAIRNFQAGEKDTFEHLVAKLIAYYKPALQTSTYRHEFYNQYQEEQNQSRTSSIDYLTYQVNVGSEFCVNQQKVQT